MMKCSCCGSKNLESITETERLPIIFYGDGRIEVRKDKVFICLECGHIDFFDTAYISNQKEKMIKNEKAQEEIEKLNKEIDALKKIPFDSTPFENNIKRLKEEIKTLESLSASRKDIQSRKDSIADYEKIIAKRVDPTIQGKIFRLEKQITELKKSIK